MQFALVELFLLLVPGFLITALLGIRRYQLLFTIAFSFAAFVVQVSLGRNYYWSVGELSLSLGLVPAALLCILIVLYRDGVRVQGNAIRRLLDNRLVLGGYLIVGSGYLIWYLIGGPYTEVPADLYRHLEFARNQFGFIESNSLGPPLSLTQIASQHGGFWYVLIAIAAHLTDTRLIDTLYPVMLIGGLLFLLATFQFSLALFSALKLTHSQRVAAAILTCILVCLQMGVSAFSFVRYYAYAPAMLNSVVTMAALVCVVEPGWRRVAGVALREHLTPVVNRLLLLALCGGTALVMHRQEAVFVGVTLVALIGWLGFEWSVQTLQRRGWGLLPAGVTMTIIVIALGLIAFWANTLVFDSAAIPQSGSGKVVALPLAWPGFGPLHILNPRYQFAQVVTIWGALVIVGFLCALQFFRDQPLLVAGMLTPLISVFNPLFVDLFLRVEDDHSLWRLCLLMPLFPVAALLLVRSVSRWNERAAVQRTAGVALSIALLVLPLLSALNPHVRTTNLPVASANSYHLWSDALDYLDSMPGRERILTDPVTGYLVSGLTPHRTFRYKFLASEQYRAFQFAYDNYADSPLARYRGWLLLVNLRDGAPSRTGRIAGHWPENIMRVSQYYPDALLTHLAENPDRFEVLWSAGDVALYRIIR